MSPHDWYGHTATAKNNSTYFDDLDARLSSPTSDEADAITKYISGESNMASLVDSLSQNRNLSLHAIDKGLAGAGVSTKSRESIMGALAKTRSRTATRPSGKAPPTKSQKLMSGLMERRTKYTGKPQAPGDAHMAITAAIQRNLQKIYKTPIDTEGVA
jgi:hypothetical protein